MTNRLVTESLGSGRIAGTGIMNLPLVRQSAEVFVPPLPNAGLASSLERRRLRFYTIQLLGDLGALFGSFAVAGFLYSGNAHARSVLLPAELILPIFVTIALYNGSYSRRSLSNWREGTGRVLSALFLSSVLVNLVAFFAKINAVFSRGTFAIAILIAAAAITVMRRSAVRFVVRRWGPNAANVLVIDDGGPFVDLANVFRINARDLGLTPSLDDPQMLSLLAGYVRNMDEVIVTCPSERRVRWSMVLKGAGIQGEVLDDFIDEIGALGVVHRPDLPFSTLLVSTGPLGLRSRAMKRLLDVSMSLMFIALALPILLLAALAIKLEDGGPVLFWQNRIGRGNRLFSICKLRTMKVEHTDRHGLRSVRIGDRRVTRVGRFLRRTSIDELPQLFNVLRGDMSLVGPRPHAIGSLAGDKLFWEVDNRYWQRHALRPGLTGLAQVRGFRGATDCESDLSQRLQADLEYISGWTIWRDLRIILQTSLVLVHDRAF